MRINDLFLPSMALIYLVFILLAVPNGVDWTAYSSISIDFSKFYFYREPIGWLLVSFFQNNEYGNTFIALIIGFCLIASSYYFLTSGYKVSYRVVFSVIFLLTFSNFFLLLSVNGLRQGLALSLFIFSFGALLRNKILMSFVLLIASVACHNSAILFSPVLFASRYPKKLVTNVGLLLLILIGPYLPDIASKSSQLSVNNNTWAFFAVVLANVLIWLVFRILNRRVYDDSITYAMLVLLLISVVFVNNNAVFERIAYYIIPLMILINSIALSNVKNRNFILIVLLVIVIASITYSINHPSVTGNFKNL